MNKPLNHEIMVVMGDNREYAEGRVENARLKRQALQIAMQLPESKAEALEVLQYVRELVDWELGNSTAAIVRLVAPATG